MTPLAAALQGIVDFTSPIFIAWEGMSMYFEEAEPRGMLAGMVLLLAAKPEPAVARPCRRASRRAAEIFPEVKAFMTGMQLLGEPFVFGVKSAKEFMESNGFRCHQTVSSDVFLGERTDPVYSTHFICTASAEAVPTMGGTAGEESSWTAEVLRI